MTEWKSPFGEGARGALAAGADRMHRVASELKAQQLAESRGYRAAERQPVTVASPDERWSQRFMSRAIGAESQVSGLFNWSPPAPPVPSLSIEPLTPEPVAPVAVVAPELPPASIPRALDFATLKEQVGKPEIEPRRRSWFGRLFRAS